MMAWIENVYMQSLERCKTVLGNTSSVLITFDVGFTNNYFMLVLLGVFIPSDTKGLKDSCEDSYYELGAPDSGYVYAFNCYVYLYTGDYSK